ncbi:MAG: hypothetical protein P4L53_14065 [Candidatus Obscuribacterales bacterium]|nr:hypothetical protein [Candidatus Obscuribacterales bacterium]
MSNFSEAGEAKALTGLVEARLNPSQSPAEKETEEHAITRELNSLSPQELQRTIIEFKKLNTGGWHEIGATENKSGTGEVTSIDFDPRGYTRGNSEPFNIKLK